MDGGVMPAGRPGEPIHAIIVLVPAKSLLHYLTGRRRLSNVPEGAVQTATWMHTGGPDGVRALYLALRIEHESFRAVPCGLRIPFVRARFERRPESTEETR